MILRLYGTARVIHARDKDWASLLALFSDLPGARQIFDFQIEMVQTSCGMGVPYFDFAGDRDDLKQWAARKSEDKLRDYWQEKNELSIDGKPTYLFNDS